MTGPDLVARLLITRPSGFTLDVDIAIQPGRTVALLGPNGSGKSTVVEAISGLKPLGSGRIRLGERVLDDPARGVFVAPERRRVGVVFQEALVFPHLSVADNVAFGLRSAGIARRRALARAAEWLERVGLEDLSARRGAELSGGEAQRVALARALITQPQLLLLDEPLSALDVTTRTTLRRELAEHLAAFAGPRLLITHEPAEAFLLADEIHVIEGGAVTQVGTADDIRLRPRTPYAADLAGANLIRGVAGGGRVDTGSHLLHVADHGAEGPVLVTIQPAAVSVHRQQPEGSARNSWATTVERVEALGDRIRFLAGSPLSLTVEITRQSAEELDVATGSRVWLAIKATEIGVEEAPDFGSGGGSGGFRYEKYG